MLRIILFYLTIFIVSLSKSFCQETAAASISEYYSIPTCESLLYDIYTYGNKFATIEVDSLSSEFLQTVDIIVLQIDHYENNWYVIEKDSLGEFNIFLPKVEDALDWAYMTKIYSNQTDFLWTQFIEPFKITCLK